MINLEKMGKFLRKNREKLNLSQTQLGRKVYVTRQAVSQWELGKTFPDLQSAIELAKLFNVNIGDIYAGEILGDKNKYNSIIEFVIKSEMKRMRKIITMLVISLFVILLLFLSYYFISVYNKINIYTINTIEEPYQISGIITKSVNDIYINFELNQEVDNLCLIYNNTRLKCMEDTNYFVIKETIGYNEQLPELSKVNMNSFINNLYIEINDSTKIKLNITHDYKNDRLIFNKDNKNSNYDEEYPLESTTIPEKVKEKFKYIQETNSYEYTKDKLKIIFNTSTNIVEVYLNKNKNNYTWFYDLNKERLVYYVKQNDKSKELIEELKEEEISDDINKRFIENYLEKYIY